MYDVVSLGECLIDFIPAGKNDMGMPIFSQNPGGAPANVLAMNARMGGRTAFIGKVGRDTFGEWLQAYLEEIGINCNGMLKDSDVPTTLAFVRLDKNGDRSFTFYRNPGADMMLKPEEIDTSLLENCRIFHFGSVSLTGEPCRSATYYAVKKARAAGALISYDPNNRPLLWKNKANAYREMKNALRLADIVKVNEEEMTLLTGETDLCIGAAKLRELGPKAVFVTCGSNGVYFRIPAGQMNVPAYKVDVVDTTGCGDAFWGALLSQIHGRGLSALYELTLGECENAAKIANAAGSLTAAAKGAIPAMPDRYAIAACTGNILIPKRNVQKV